jgi:ribosomal protein L17
MSIISDRRQAVLKNLQTKIFVHQVIDENFSKCDMMHH